MHTYESIYIMKLAMQVEVLLSGFLVMKKMRTKMHNFIIWLFEQ